MQRTVEPTDARRYAELVTVRMSSAMRSALDEICASEDRSLGYVIRRALRQTLESHDER
jgi:predicted transcriptional regulator